MEGAPVPIRYSPHEFDGWRSRHWTLPFEVSSSSISTTTCQRARRSAFYYLLYLPTSLPYLRTPFQGERFSLVWFSPAEEMEDGGDLGDRYALPIN